MDMDRRQCLQHAALAAGALGLGPARLITWANQTAPEDQAMTHAREPHRTIVFAAGADGYPCCRIPSLLATPQGTLLAFCEGRQSRSDHAQNDIILKRSPDGGQSWSAVARVADAGTDSLNDPSAVVDRRTGRILLHYTRFAEGYHTDRAVPGYTDRHASRNLLTWSDDDGVTWAAPADLTRQVKRPDVRCAVVTCGIGIQLRRGPQAGRLVHAVYQFGGPPGQEAYVCFSDDGGATWGVGGIAPTADGDQAAEPQVVELADGRLMLNARTRSKRRRVARSTDGGATFGPLLSDPTLVEPACQASILRYSDPLDDLPSRLLFSNPASQSERVCGTVRLSLDEGESWSAGRVLAEGSFAYSCLTVLGDGSIGCLYEADEYGRIVFGRFSLEWVAGG
ncbi:MAG: sialidase family protein [Candidatus Latescibacterota bacterium]